jgi:hypothetical protein
MAHNALAVDLLALGRPDEAQTGLQRALEALTRLRGACHPKTRLVRENLARSQREGGHAELAATGLRVLLEECADARPPPEELERWRAALTEAEADHSAAPPK